jgi:glycerol uptake facilitator-like aquaporin
MKSEQIAIIFFEFIGVTILAYGICMGRYQHPIEDHKINPNFDFLISCFFYFAVSVAGPFSGGHLNPAVTLAFSLFKRKVNTKIYIVSQMLGGLFGAGIGTFLPHSAYLFFRVVPFPYAEEVSFGSLVLDTLAETFGTFVFIFFILVIV